MTEEYFEKLIIRVNKKSTVSMKAIPEGYQNSKIIVS